MTTGQTITYYAVLTIGPALLAAFALWGAWAPVGEWRYHRKVRARLRQLGPARPMRRAA